MQTPSIILTIKFGMSIVQIPNVTTINLEPIVVILFFHSSMLDMTIHMHKCQHATLHNQPQQVSSVVQEQMICLYKGTMDDLIQVFMHIVY